MSFPKLISQPLDIVYSIDEKKEADLSEIKSALERCQVLSPTHIEKLSLRSSGIIHSLTTPSVFYMVNQLDLSNNVLNVDARLKIVEWIANPRCHWSKLNLSNCGLKTTTSIQLLESLCKNKSLEILELKNNQISLLKIYPQGFLSMLFNGRPMGIIRALCNVLRNNSTISSISFSESWFQGSENEGQISLEESVENEINSDLLELNAALKFNNTMTNLSGFFDKLTPNSPFYRFSEIKRRWLLQNRYQLMRKAIGSKISKPENAVFIIPILAGMLDVAECYHEQIIGLKRSVFRRRLRRMIELKKSTSPHASVEIHRDAVII